MELFIKMSEKEDKVMMDYVKEITWQEFKDSGVLWWINMILHTFGMAIVCEIADDEITKVYPARVKFRGFFFFINTEGYQKISRYLRDNACDLEREANT